MRTLEQQLAIHWARTSWARRLWTWIRALVTQQDPRNMVMRDARRHALAALLEVGRDSRNAADWNSVEAIRAAADARSRALHVLAAGGAMAERKEPEDFTRAARVAESQAAIERFNASLPLPPDEDK